VLEGLCDGQTVWRTQEQITSYRGMLARIAAREAERAAEWW
jgi:hypothetical protein